jgi:hypothetical protein
MATTCEQLRAWRDIGPGWHVGFLGICTPNADAMLKAGGEDPSHLPAIGTPLLRKEMRHLGIEPKIYQRAQGEDCVFRKCRD